MKGKYKGGSKVQEISSNVDSLEKNYFYSLRTRGEQETSSDVVTGMFKLFSIDVYLLLDPTATL